MPQRGIEETGEENYAAMPCRGDAPETAEMTTETR